MSNYYFNNKDFRTDILDMLVFVVDNNIDRGFEKSSNISDFCVSVGSIIHPLYRFYESVLKVSKNNSIKINNRKDLVYVGNIIYQIDGYINNLYEENQKGTLTNVKKANLLSSIISTIKCVKEYDKVFDEDNIFIINLNSSLENFIDQYEYKIKKENNFENFINNNYMNSIMYNNYFHYLLLNNLIELNKNKVSENDLEKIIVVFDIITENKGIIAACYDDNDRFILEETKKNISLLNKNMEKIKNFLATNCVIELTEPSKFQVTTSYKI